MRIYVNTQTYLYKIYEKILPEKRIYTKYDTNQWVPFEANI